MFFTLALMFSGLPVYIRDVSVTEQGCVINCTSFHGVLVGRSVDVIFHETLHPLLQQQKAFRLRADNKTKLSLLGEDGQKWTADDPSVEAAAGCFYIKPNLLNVASIGIEVPFLIIIEALILVWISLIVFSSTQLLVVLSQVTWSILVALICHRVRLWSASKRPIDEAIRLFIEEMSRQSHKCDPGPYRAVTIGSLCQLFDSFQSFIGRRNMYFLEPYLVRPLTRAMQLSFAELVGPKRLDFFVSHFWGLAFVETLESLRKHAQASKIIGKEISEIAYWICTFSNNQWKLSEEIPPLADPSLSSFYKALTSGFCHATCMVINEKVEPLKRSWCLYELFLTFVLKDRGTLGSNKIPFQGLLLLTPSGVLNSGKSSIDIALAVAESAANLRLEDARASRIEDELMIKQKILAEYRSFTTPNNKLKKEIRGIVKMMRSQTQTGMGRLLQSLKSKSDMQTDDETDEDEDCSITAAALSRASLLQSEAHEGQCFRSIETPVEIELRQICFDGNP